MKRLVFVAWIAVAASIAVAPPAGAARVDPPAWAEEFDGTSLATSRWSHRASGPRWDGVLTPDAVSLGGGLLTIRTYTQSGTHYSGMISTQRALSTGFEQTYGHFEARIRFNSARGQWSAFWLQSPTMGLVIGDPGTSGVEMDVAEHRARCVAPPTPSDVCTASYDISDRIQHAMLWDGYGADGKAVAELSEPLAGLGNGSWHTWALHWTPTDVVFLYDNEVIWSLTGPISRRSQFIVLSSEVGAFFAGAIPAGGYGSRETSTTNMQVDYVRVWQTTPPTSTVAPTVSGTPKVGVAISCSPGSWSGNPEPALAYQWLADGAAINGATSSTYTPQGADAGHDVACRVTASNSVGSASAASEAVTIAAAAPVQPVAPVAPAPAPSAAPAPPAFQFVAPPQPLPAPDTDPPNARLSGSRSQRIASTVAVTIGCPDEACLATTSGSLRVPRAGDVRARTYLPAARTTVVAQGARVAVRLRVARAVRAAISRALRARLRSVLRLRVLVADRAGNTRTLTREVTFRR